MKTGKWKKTMALLGIFTFIAALLLPGMAMAATPELVSDLYITDKIISDMGKLHQEETVPPVSQLSHSSKSLWYNDLSTTYHIITTFDNHGAVKHYKDSIQITMLQVGQGRDDLDYILIDGKKAYSDSATLEVISSYPYQFKAKTHYTFNKHRIDPDAPYTIFTFGNMSRNTNTTGIMYTRRETNVYVYWDSGDRAEAPNVFFKFDAESGKMRLSGADSSMEYRLKSASSSSWKPCTDEPMYFDGGADPLAYYVRYAATDESEASQTQELVLPALRAAPAVSYSTITEQLTKLTSQMEWKIGDDAYTPVVEDTISLTNTINALLEGEQTKVCVRYMATATQQAGREFTYTIYPRSATPTALSLDPITLALSGCDSTMQYKGDTESSWKAITGSTVSLVPYATGEREVSILVRKKPTSTASASLPVEFKIPQLLPGPTVNVDYTKEAVIGLENGNYQYSTNGTSWSALSVTNGEWNLAQQITTSGGKILYLRKAATDTAPITAYSTFEIPARLAAPSGLSFVYNHASYPEKAVLTGLTTEMQYKKSTDTEWTNANGGPVVLDVPTANVTYYARLKATDQEFASLSRSLTLYKRGTAPSVSYSTTTELFTSLTTKMEMAIGDKAYTPVESTSFSATELIDNLPEGASLTIRVRTAATATAPASVDKVFTLYSRAAQPSTVTFDPASISLKGCTTAMQYKIDNASSWTAVSGTTVSLQSYVKDDRDITVYIRMKPTSTKAASLPVAFTVPQLIEGPVGTVDYIAETIVGLENGNYQYSLNKTSWSTVSVTNNTWSISSLITTSTRSIYLRKAATATEPMTAYSTFVIDARPAAPSAGAFCYNDVNNSEKAVLTGLTTEMQYRKSTDTEWTNASNDSVVLDIPAANTTYYVRWKATGEKFASANRTLTLYKQGVAPSVSYSTTTELFTSLTTKMEMAIGDKAYMPVEATSFSATELIDTLPEGASLTIRVRTVATATSPASLDKVFTLYSRAAKPSTVTFDPASISLKGCTTAMQYKIDNASSWTAVSGTTVSLQSYVKDDRDITVYIRMKPTSTKAASLPVAFTVPQLLEGPVGTIDYAAETIVGLENGNYQYSLNKTSWSTVSVTNNTWSISSLITTSTRSIYLRKAATATEPMTAYSTFVITTRPAAPSAGAFCYNDVNNPEKAVLTGLTTEMQYRKSTDTEWTNASGAPVVLDLPSANVTYYVRWKATGEKFASANRTLTLYKQGVAPSVSYSTTTELFTSLTTKMEMAIGDEAYTPVESTSFSATELIDNLPEGASLTIRVRTAATATAPASLDKVFILYSRGEEPSTVTFDSETYSLIGCTSAMEYRIDGNTAWSTGTGKTLDFKSSAQSDREVILYVRSKATTSSSASLPIEFVIPVLTSSLSNSLEQMPVSENNMDF